MKVLVNNIEPENHILLPTSTRKANRYTNVIAADEFKLKWSKQVLYLQQFNFFKYKTEGNQKKVRDYVTKVLVLKPHPKKQRR